MMPLQTVGSLGERKEEGFAQKLGLFIPCLSGYRIGKVHSSIAARFAERN
jgi:hypothetical protein